MSTQEGQKNQSENKDIVFLHILTNICLHFRRNKLRKVMLLAKMRQNWIFYWPGFHPYLQSSGKEVLPLTYFKFFYFFYQPCKDIRGKPEQDSKQDKESRTEQTGLECYRTWPLEKHRSNWTAGTGQLERIVGSVQPGQKREDRKARTWKQGQDNWDSTAGTGQPGQDNCRHDSTIVTRHQGHDSYNRTIRTGSSG